MIISASRRTDIPAFYSDWFSRRLNEGFCLVRNPYNNKPSVVTLADAEGIVFWTKDSGPMHLGLSRLIETGIPFYFQFTVTGYGDAVEKNVPGKKTDIIPNFLALARTIGPSRVIWRYDPVFLGDRYDISWHARAFAGIAKKLEGATDTCVFSFGDIYPGNEASIRRAGLRAPDTQEMKALASAFLESAELNHMRICACAEDVPMPEGIGKNACIDAALLSTIAKRPVRAAKDQGQRKACGCAKSRDIGAYATCRHGCVYCYAMGNASFGRHDPDSPFLAGSFASDDERRLYEEAKRAMRAREPVQAGLFDAVPR